jgi:hypothetical protein
MTSCITAGTRGASFPSKDGMNLRRVPAVPVIRITSGGYVVAGAPESTGEALNPLTIR